MIDRPDFQLEITADGLGLHGRPFLHLFALHFSTRMIRNVAAALSQDEADEVLREVALPIKSGCEREPTAAARN